MSKYIGLGPEKISIKWCRAYILLQRQTYEKIITIQQDTDLNEAYENHLWQEKKKYQYLCGVQGRETKEREKLGHGKLGE